MATGKQRADLSRARREVLSQLGESIETADMPDNSRIQLRILFVQAMLACKQQAILGQMMASIDGYGAIIQTAALVLDDLVRDNPDSPLAIIMESANDQAEKQLGDEL